MREVPVLLLDVDGTLCPTAGPGSRWPAWQGAFVEFPDGHMRALWAARPVLEFFRHVHDQGAVEIRWHSAWHRTSKRVGDAFGLAEFTVQDCPEYDPGFLTPDAAEVPAAGWWKEPTVRRVAQTRDVILLDDDARHLTGGDRHRFGSPWPDAFGAVTIIAPNPRVGLTRWDLQVLGEVLRVDYPRAYDTHPDAERGHR